MSYDPMCDELARHFIGDIPQVREDDIEGLAQRFQDLADDVSQVIEDRRE